MKRIITAIDIGSSKICTIIAAIDEGQETPQVIGVSVMPSRGIKKGVIINIDDAVNSIGECLEAAEKMAGLTVSSAVISINGKHITSTNNRGVVAVSHDEITEDDISRAIENARTVAIPSSREIIHVLKREYIVDAQGGIVDPLGMSGDRLEVDTHIISATTTAVQNLVKTVNQLALQIDDIVFAGFASSEAVLTDTEKELGVTMLDIGAGTTDVCVYVEDAISYSGCVPIGGDHITSDLAIGFMISIEDARRLKEKIGMILEQNERVESDKNISAKPAFMRRDKEEFSKEDKEDKEEDEIDISSLNIPDKPTISKSLYDKIVSTRVEEIFDIVSEQVKQAGFDIRQPAGIVLTGGTANLVGITKLAKDYFGVPARVGTPSGLTGFVEEISGPAYATAYGLILRGLDLGMEEIGGEKFEGRGVVSIISRIGSFIKKLIP
uniref:Cell division protein FtsA n=1 Tax=candidate division CPR3 bacterium TaxID=2268181 RepID=A0A7C5YXF2_UNCC3